MFRIIRATEGNSKIIFHILQQQQHNKKKHVTHRRDGSSNMFFFMGKCGKLPINYPSYSF